MEFDNVISDGGNDVRIFADPGILPRLLLGTLLHTTASGWASMQI